MPRDFNQDCIEYAMLNQCPFHERTWGYIYCYTCGKKIYTGNPDEKWHTCPIIPLESRGRFNKENCMIVCDDCYTKIMKERQEEFNPPSKPKTDSMYSDE